MIRMEEQSFIFVDVSCPEILYSSSSSTESENASDTVDNAGVGVGEYAGLSTDPVSCDLSGT